MMHRPSYKNIHNRFRLNGTHYSFEALTEIGYSFVKEGAPYEQAIGDFLLDWTHASDTLILKTSGSTGQPKLSRYHKQAMVNSSLATGDFFHLQVGDKALHCLNADYIAGKMMLVRAMILGLEIDLVPPEGNVLQHTNKVYDFAAMVPLQVAHSLSQLPQIKTLIIGGAPIPKALHKEIVQQSTACFETYGMTETVSHIAARPINEDATPFHVLPGVSISQDERECLVIEAPHLSDQKIITNDLVHLVEQEAFHFRGRIDHVINSGGIKISPEEIEAKLSPFIVQPILIAALPDESLGEKMVLLVEGSLEVDWAALFSKAKLPHYSCPKEVHSLAEFAYTPNGKIKREATLALLDL